MIAVVTGGASGIGRALATALAARGAIVGVLDRDAAGAEAVARAIGGWARAVDVTDAGAVEAAVAEAFARHGRLDLLFNNAGVGVAGEVRDLGPEDWRRAIDVNLLGVVHGVQAAYPRMVRQGSGHIVNTASGAALAPRPGMVPYAAAKAGVVALSLSLRAEARDLGVRVSVACPGFVDTGIFSATRYVGVDEGRLRGRVPVRPMGAETCAARILRGVDANEAIILDSAYVRLEWWLTRLSPALATRLAGVRTRAFRAARVAP